MRFYENQLFHIYNQGNNKQPIFFSDENYIFFLWKMRAHLPLFGDLISYCLMPNHFHWQFYVRKVEVKRSELRAWIDKIEILRRRKTYGRNAIILNKNNRKADKESFITLNDSIGNLQRAYTRAVNKEQERTGSLFQKNCKTKDGWEDGTHTKDTDFRFSKGNNYLNLCLSYIHNNPRKAGLVENNTDWIYSSAKDYEGLRNGTLCNLKLGREMLNEW